MTEFFLPFLIGYGVARLTSFMVSSSVSSSINKRNILLKWDDSTFAWRPCPISMLDESTEKYMIATPVSLDALKLIKNSHENG